MVQKKLNEHDVQQAVLEFIAKQGYKNDDWPVVIKGLCGATACTLAGGLARMPHTGLNKAAIQRGLELAIQELVRRTGEALQASTGIRINIDSKFQ